MTTTPRFGFYEKVIITSSDGATAEINGQPGTILGRACDDDGRWTYAVAMDQGNCCWCCQESEVRSTGVFDVRETFFDGSSVRISQNGELLG